VSSRLRRLVTYAVIGVVIVISLFPFWWMLSLSLKHRVEIFAGFTLFPVNPTLDNYEQLFSQNHMGEFLLNSIVVVGVSTAASLLIGAPAAYALARSRLVARLNSIGLMAALLVRIVPAILLVVPFYLALVQVGLFNSKLGLIIVYTAIDTSFVVWMMQSFLAEIPKEIEEAALVDGDTPFSAMRRVILPLAAPGLAATAIFVVVATYNDFLIALTITANPDAQTVPVGISTLIGKTQVDWGPMAAAGVIGVLPILIFTALAQRQIVRGLTMGAVK
jgi:multiple sugar transport system permease protein